MLVCDYIRDFFIKKNIYDIFGYPGGMVTYLMDSISKKEMIKLHTNYHEQASSFAACSYAQAGETTGVAYATSGPGFTNLITGIANAYFDSIPVIYITGQVNTYEAKNNSNMRQKGFQETEVIPICKSITKYAKKIIKAEDIVYELEKAYFIANDGRKGPVLLDIPMNIQRTEIDINKCRIFHRIIDNYFVDYKKIALFIANKIGKSLKPIIIVGAGVSKNNNIKKYFKKFIDEINIPVVSSMIGIDTLENDNKNNMGFIGAYGHRYANFAVMKSDLVIVLGSRLDCRQTASNRREFAPKAEIIRIDIDEFEFENPIRDNDNNIKADIETLIKYFCNNNLVKTLDRHNKWRNYCTLLKEKLRDYDEEPANKFIKKFSELIDENAIITTDVGQNQVWIAQSFKIKKNQKVLFSGGLGSMGYSLPASIGAYYATNKYIICFVGDGGLQMNIQELQYIKENNLPIKIIVINNKSLGMIRHFQEMYFNSNFTQTKEKMGYSSPNFVKIAEAYGIDSINFSIESDVNLLKKYLINDSPVLINVELSDTTYVFPKLAINKPINDQEPEMKRDLFNRLMKEI